MPLVKEAWAVAQARSETETTEEGFTLTFCPDFLHQWHIWLGSSNKLMSVNCFWSQYFVTVTGKQTRT